ncbi:MAG: hypothetical protein ACRENK_05145 [Gemmatimonadaceae bacterium]
MPNALRLPLLGFVATLCFALASSIAAAQASPSVRDKLTVPDSGHVQILTLATARRFADGSSP